MTKTITELKAITVELLTRKHFSVLDAEIISNDYIEAECRGKKTHGVDKFIKEFPLLKKPVGNPEIILDKGSILLINGNHQVGQIAAQFATDLVIERAKKFGTSIVGLKNIQRYGILETWVRKIANSDLIGIIANTSEPAAAPFGSTSKILGSNPIALGIPSLPEPIVLDMATSKVAMSTIWQCMMEEKSLPTKTFFDKNGAYTTNPYDAESVEIFGGYKGYGLSLIIEILAGSLLTANMGSKIQSAYDIGYYFQAIDPSVFQNIKTFKGSNNKLVQEIKSGRRQQGVDEILVPGEKSQMIMKNTLSTQQLEISRKTWKGLLDLKN